MPPLLHRRVVLSVAGVLLGTGLGACATGSAGGHPAGPDGPRMGGGHGHRTVARDCRPPADLPGTRVTVRLGEGGMAHAAGGMAPAMGAHLVLRASTDHVPAGDVSFVALNHGMLTHELVVLPLAPGVPAGRRAVGADGQVSERGSLGEASRPCGADGGDGLRAGSAGWTTIRLPAGRYELVCNLPRHYAGGMHQALVVG